MNQPSFYAIIPANVRYDKTLPPLARLLYGEITALTNQRGYCWATNKYFADLYEVDTRTIRRWISALCDRGLLRTEQKPGLQRLIFLCHPRTEMSPPPDNRVPPPGQKCPPPPDRNVLHNNIYNNTLNNTCNRQTDTYENFPKSNNENTIHDNEEKKKRDFTAPGAVTGAMLQENENEFQKFCRKHELSVLITFPRPLSDVNFHKLQSNHNGTFVPEMQKMNDYYAGRTVKDMNRTVLNWFKRVRDNVVPEYVAGMLDVWREKYKAQNGLYPTSKRSDKKDAARIAQQLSALKPGYDVLDQWRVWCDMLFKMKDDKRFSWKKQLIGALANNFSSITVDMKAQHEREKPVFQKKNADGSRELDAQYYADVIAELEKY